MGTKDVWVDVLKLSTSTRVKIYAGEEGEPLGEDDFITAASQFEDPIFLGDRVGEILRSGGTNAKVLIGLANWGSENILIEDEYLGLFYVNDRGEGFVPLTIPNSDGKTIFPGTMGLLEIDPEGQDEGFTVVDLNGGEEILIAWGGSGPLPGAGSSGGCFTVQGLPMILLLGLPLIPILFHRR